MEATSTETNGGLSIITRDLLVGILDRYQDHLIYPPEVALSGVDELAEVMAMDDRNRFTERLPRTPVHHGSRIIEGITNMAIVQYTRTEEFEEYADRITHYVEGTQALTEHFFGHGIVFGMRLKLERQRTGTSAS